MKLLHFTLVFLLLSTTYVRGEEESIVTYTDRLREVIERPNAVCSHSPQWGYCVGCTHILATLELEQRIEALEKEEQIRVLYINKERDEKEFEEDCIFPHCNERGTHFHITH